MECDSNTSIQKLISPSSSSTKLLTSVILEPSLSVKISTMFICPPRSFIKSLLKVILKLLINLWKLASSFAIVVFFAAWFYGGILPYLVCFAALLSLGYHLSDTLLYQPDVPPESRIFVPSPQSFSLPYESVSIYSKDRVKLHAYLIKQEVSNSRNLPCIVYFHGNAGNIGHRLENVKMMHSHLKCNILLIEYRGYGRSEGYPFEQGLYLDAQAALDFVVNREDLDSSKIILFGRSLGGAVAIDLAARCDFRDQIAALIVENTFKSIPDLAEILFPFKFMQWIPRVYYKNQYDSYKKCSSLVCPTLFVSGVKDELVPCKQMTDLYSKCSANFKQLKRLPGGHNDTWASPEYFSSLFHFIEKALSSEHERQSVNITCDPDDVV